MGGKNMKKTLSFALALSLILSVQPFISSSLTANSEDAIKQDLPYER